MPEDRGRWLQGEVRKLLQQVLTPSPCMGPSCTRAVCSEVPRIPVISLGLLFQLPPEETLLDPTLGKSGSGLPKASAFSVGWRDREEGAARLAHPSPGHQHPPGRGHSGEGLGVGQARPEPCGRGDRTCGTRGARKPWGLDCRNLLLWLSEPLGEFPVPTPLYLVTFLMTKHSMLNQLKSQD